MVGAVGQEQGSPWPQAVGKHLSSKVPGTTAECVRLKSKVFALEHQAWAPGAQASGPH